MDESIVRHLEQQQVGKLKLSEAMRIGARLRPQCCSGDLFVGGKSCAVGAAMEAIGVPYTENMGSYSPAAEYWPFLPTLFGVITDLNDSQFCTREKIADWVEAQGY